MHSHAICIGKRSVVGASNSSDNLGKACMRLSLSIKGT